jgi:hypothetical protein
VSSFKLRSLVCCLILLTAHAVGAQAAPLNEAEVLFQSGKSELAQGRYPEACLLLDRSYRLEPAVGALLALAFCQEQGGNLATAHRLYLAAAERSREAGRSDREQAARERAEALWPKLSTLTLELDGAAQLGAARGLVVEVDGMPLDASRLGLAVPLDGGTHRIKVSAPERFAFEASVELAVSRDAQRLSVPGMAAEAPAPAAARPSPARAAPASAARSRLTPLQWVGLSSITVGTGALIASMVYTGRAVRANDESEPLCLGNVCSIEGREARIEARQAGHRATITLVSGAVLVTAGVLAAVLGKRSRADQRPPARAWNAAPWASSHAAGASVEGSF